MKNVGVKTLNITDSSGLDWLMEPDTMRIQLCIA